MSEGSIQPVVLCGGAGTRLWPFSRPDRPKPFLALTSEQSLLAQTLARVSDAGLFVPPIVIGGTAHVEELTRHAASAANIVLEPFGRNTAPAIAAAALLAGRPDQLLLVMPSDHLILDPQAFLAAAVAAAPLAAEGWLMTFGIRPTRAETGYGYIRRGELIGAGAYEAPEFVEKPDLAKAESYVASGNFDWNAGIFLLRADRYLDELRAQRPEVLDCVERAVGPAREGPLVELDKEAFSHCPDVSIDVAVMEHAPRVGVVPVDMGWSDVGSWDVVLETTGTDTQGNAIQGPVDARGVSGSLLYSDGPRLIVVDADDLIVVATAEGVLVTRRGSSHTLKQLVEGKPNA